MEGISYLYQGRPTIDKDPQAQLDYGFDWTDWLASSGPDTIAAFSVSTTGGLTAASVAHAAGVVTCVVSGGSVGVAATITCSITTTGPPARVDERTIWVNVVQR